MARTKKGSTSQSRRQTTMSFGSANNYEGKDNQRNDEEPSCNPTESMTDDDEEQSDPTRSMTDDTPSNVYGKRIVKTVRYAPRPSLLEQYPLDAQFYRRERAVNAPYIVEDNIRRMAAIGIAAAEALEELPDINQGKKKVRGCAKSDSMLPIDRNQRYVLEWNSNGIPIGEEGRKFNLRIAAIAKMSEIWPVCRDWNEHNYTPFKKTWRYLQEDFELYGHYNAWEYVFQKVKADIGEWTRMIKRDYYEEYDNNAMRYKKLDPRVDPYQFAHLMSIWDSEHFKKISAKNRENVKKRKMHHRGGSRPLAELERIMTIENKGVPPKPVELQCRAYNPPNPKTEVPDSTKKLLNKMSVLAFNATQKSQELKENENQMEETQYEIIHQVLEVKKKTYSVRLKGTGAIIPHERTRRNKQPVQHEQAEKKFTKMKKHVNELTDYIGKISQFISQILPESMSLPPPPMVNFDSDNECESLESDVGEQQSSPPPPKEQISSERDDERKEDRATSTTVKERSINSRINFSSDSANKETKKKKRPSSSYS